MKKMIILTMFLILTGTVIAQDQKGKEICDYLIHDLGITNETKVPKGIPFNNEVLNIYTHDSQIVGHIELQKKRVASISCETAQEPTYDVKVESLDTLKDIMSAEKPLDELNKKISDKEIIIEGQSTGKKLKGFFTKIGLKIAGWFD